MAAAESVDVIRTEPLSAESTNSPSAAVRPADFIPLASPTSTAAAVSAISVATTALSAAAPALQSSPSNNSSNSSESRRPTEFPTRQRDNSSPRSTTSENEQVEQASTNEMNGHAEMSDEILDMGLTQVQHNVLVAEQMVKSQIFACVYCAPIVLAIAVVVSSEWHASCDSFLQLWLAGVAVLQILRLPMRLVLIRRLMAYVHDEAQDDLLQFILEDIRRSKPHMSLSFLNVVSLVWYLLGIVETLRTEDCEDKAPDTYKLSLALVIIFLVFLGLSCLCRLLYICLICFHHICFPPPPNHNANLLLANAGASEEVLEALPRFVFGAQTQMPEEDLVCAICLDEFKPTDEVSRLPCGHYFHYSEISQWLKDKRTCPLCNQEVTLKGLTGDSGSDAIQGEENA